jgi:YD repeat-containing protein
MTPNVFKRLASLLVALSAPAALAHVTISPRESLVHKDEQYTMRVPTERESPTVQIEAEFPSEVSVTGVDSKEGWTIELRRNADGRIIGAVWKDGSIAPGQTEQFGFAARNPAKETTLVWKVIQIHSDGVRAEWIEEAGSRRPAPVVVVHSAEAQ